MFNRSHQTIAANYLKWKMKNQFPCESKLLNQHHPSILKCIHANSVQYSHSFEIHHIIRFFFWKQNFAMFLSKNKSIHKNIQNDRAVSFKCGEKIKQECNMIQLGDILLISQIPSQLTMLNQTLAVTVGLKSDGTNKLSMSQWGSMLCWEHRLCQSITAQHLLWVTAAGTSGRLHPNFNSQNIHWQQKTRGSLSYKNKPKQVSFQSYFSPSKHFLPSCVRYKV